MVSEKCPVVAMDQYTENLSGFLAMSALEEMIVFIWVPGQVGGRGKLAADSAARDALSGDISDKLIPFSDLKPHITCEYF